MASPIGTITEPRVGSSSSPSPTYEGDFVFEDALVLDCGRVLTQPVLHYAVYGRLNEAADNAVLVCHALSGSALAGVWWPGLFDGIVDLDQECAICVNLLGSCYGSTGPGSINTEGNTESGPEVARERPSLEQAETPELAQVLAQVYGPEFPLISIGDNVRAQARLLDSLGIRKLKLAIGGSIGGMQALDWSIRYPDRVERAVIIAVAPLGAMGLALNHLQRSAIQNDPEWQDGWYAIGRQPRGGMALARQIAMLSYKSPELFQERFGRNPNRNGEDPWALDADGGGLRVEAARGRESGGRFDVAGFLDYQGERFLERFDANAYLAILRTMDTWEPARGYRDAREAFSRIEAELIFVGISSDWLFPAADVRQLAEAVKAAGARADYREMRTDHGHDAFLAEQAELVRLLG